LSGYLSEYELWRQADEGRLGMEQNRERNIWDILLRRIHYVSDRHSPIGRNAGNSAELTSEKEI